ncbi:hyaluronidase A-like isoform X2 [Leptidea sinapis]|uniref:hyaluronidase A-like isoform X2 n=1 Tax=Leptidea sinapis TaxID=189913 RepID=UPI0021C492AE|nr:hyaluronidase A-like isoform X2 [Leptidea sinapis]
MKFLVFIILARYFVRCDDDSNNYYVIELPEDVPRDYKKPFRVYWNVPTMQCKSKKILFNNLHEKYGIIQNKDDKFLGDKISILYDPGLFPALLKNESSGKFKFRNGGVPQEGDLDEHLAAFKNTVSQSIPDLDFSGIGIIDFESWRPVFRQNFGVLVPYKDVSFEIEKKRHWWWPKEWIMAEAKLRFEDFGRIFMQKTLEIAKQLRPKAVWGYYAYPYCYNMASNNMVENCPTKVQDENDKTYWLWAESTALFPSVYSSENLSSSELASLIRGRMKEASRSKPGSLILPYFWYRYRDGGFLNERDLSTALKTLYKSNASGFIIWGSSKDVNTVDKCKKLKDYVDTTFGPFIAKYTKNTNRINDDTFSDMDTTEDSQTVTDQSLENNTTKTRLVEMDPEYHWLPPENYKFDIIQNVEQEFTKKGYKASNQSDSNMVASININNSIILDTILKLRNGDMVESSTTKNPKLAYTSSKDVDSTKTSTELLNTIDSFSDINNQETTSETSDFTTEAILTSTYVYKSTDLTTEIDLVNSNEFMISTLQNSNAVETTSEGNRLERSNVYFQLHLFNLYNIIFNTLKSDCCIRQLELINFKFKWTVFQIN